MIRQVTVGALLHFCTYQPCEVSGRGKIVSQQLVVLDSYGQVVLQKRDKPN
jgi:hypothetical protein